MNLTETVKHIKRIHSQTSISIKEFDYSQNMLVEKPNPKYLFRGEKIYPTTKSNYHRQMLSKNEQQYILDLSLAIYLEFIGEIEPNKPEYHCNINQIAAILQHYGFSIMWLDFSKEIEVAAFFASYNNNTKQGRIWVSETKKLVEQEHIIFKLEFNDAIRPKRQKAYALKMFDICPDFQNTKFYSSIQYKFDLTVEDIIKYDNQLLLNTLDDRISDFIIEFIESNKLEDQLTMEKMNSIKDNLKSHRRITNH